ncbi:MAG: hypothetical protein ACRCXC_09995 [Legionella sp.]
MFSSHEKMNKLLKDSVGVESTDKPMIAPAHSSICRCSLCMPTKIPEQYVDKHYHALQSTMVDRRNPDAPIKPLMLAKEAHAILHTGSTVDMLEATGINKRDLPKARPVPIVWPRELTVKAKWMNKDQEKAKSGRDASVFGSLGVLAVSKNVSVVDIPKMNAWSVPQAFLEKYGAELIPLDQPFTLDAVEHKELETLFLVEYEWDPAYIEEYVMNQRGGGGLFVETHPFPHVFTPLSPKCSGALILGVDRGDGAFDFASFEIPFGYTMKVGSNVIHGDSFFVGPYAIALTETELADSVILKQDTVKREIQTVKQTAIPQVTLPLLTEHRLASELDPKIVEMNNHMMIEKIRHEGAAGKWLGFFQHLPPDVLSEVRDLSSEAQEAYDQRFGLVPYKPS